MDDAVDRRARALEIERLEKDAVARDVLRQKREALEQFSSELLRIHSAQTAHPIAVEPLDRRDDRLSVVYFVQSPSGNVTKRQLAEVEAFHYSAPNIAVHIVERVPDDGRPLDAGNLPKEAASRIAARAVEELAKVIARGSTIISAERANAVAQAEASARLAQSEREDREARAKYEREHRWDWLSNLLAGFGVIVFLRFVIYPWLKPIIDNWFN